MKFTSYMLFILASVYAFGESPSLQFEQKGGVRSATLFSSCAETKNLFAQRLSQVEIVGRVKLRFQPPIMADSEEKKCVMSCPAGARLLALEKEKRINSIIPALHANCW